MQRDHPERSPQSWEHLFDKDPNTLAGFRIGVVAAVVIHVGVFAVTWPTIAQAPPDAPEEILYRVPIYDFVPTPPEPEEVLIELPVTRPEGPPIIDGPAEEIEFRPVVTEPIPRPTGPVIEVDFLPEPPDAPESQPVLVNPLGGVAPPEVVHRVEPRYTEAARIAKVEGVVILDLVIDTRGSVESIDVLRGLPLGLTQSAVEAVGQWRFQPSVFKGRPVAVRYILTVRFTLA